MQSIRALFSFEGRYRTLHLTWVAFFLTFVVWFNLAPFATTIKAQLGLTKAQMGTLALCNVALTVPARILVGMALDRYGPRRVYAAILIFAAVPSLAFAASSSFAMLVASRLALGIVGAGFVVGIRMVSEWFPPREVGLAEGVYGGWGNFGSAAAALTLPTLAGVFGSPFPAIEGWRLAIALTGLISAAYGFYYLRAVADTPEGVAYVRPRRQGALEVTNRGAVAGLVALTVPLTGVLVLIAWRVYDSGVLPASAFFVVIAGLAVLLAVQFRQAVVVNRPALAGEYLPEDQYPFRSVAILCLAYACTFGSEIAVVSMLPTFFEETWHLGPALAGALAAPFAVMNLVGRPLGGLLSDRMSSRVRALRLVGVGLAGGFGVLALLSPSWPVGLAVAAVFVCSFFPSAGNGTVYAIAPLVKRRVSGQIAGLVGAYGNIGAVVFLTSLLYVSERAFFLIIAGASIVSLIATRWLPEPGADHEAVFADEAEVDEVEEVA